MKFHMQNKNATRLTDLPDEILLIIIEYLRPVDAFRAFLSNDPLDRFHRLIFKYRTHVNLSVLSYSEFCYMMNTIFPIINPSELTLTNAHIPCLIDHFLSLQGQFSSKQLTSLTLIGCRTINYELTAWFSSQSKLNTLIINDEHHYIPKLTAEDLVTLRDFIFINGLPSSVKKFYFDAASGLVLYDQLQLTGMSQINDATLTLNTVDDLQILLSKGLLCNVYTLYIFLQEKRQGQWKHQESPLFLHENLHEFCLAQYDSGITPDEFAYFIRHMPMLQNLHLMVFNSTEYESFARCSYFDDILPYSIVEFNFLARIVPLTSNNIETDINDNCIHRFPMKMSENLVYTVPWRMWRLPPSIPLEDHDISLLYGWKSLTLERYWCQNLISADVLKPLYYVTKINSFWKLPSLELFPYLRILKTRDATVVHSTLPPTLCVLELIDTTPLDSNAQLSNLVHRQVKKFILKRPIRDKKNLLNVLHQFPNLQFLTLTLPSTNSKDYLYHIFHKNNVRLPHLICLQVYGGESKAWSLRPFDWLITHTPLRYRSTPFCTKYYCHNEQLIIWL